MKRGQGEGSVYQETRAGKMVWVGEVRHDGRRRRHLARTKREAQEWVRQMAEAARRGMMPAGPRQTLAQYCEWWLENVAQQRVKASTFLRYGNLLRTHALPAVGKLPLEGVTPQDLTTLYNDRLKAGSAPRTVGHVHRVLHSVLETAVRQDLLPRNPCDRVDPPRVPYQEMKALTLEEAWRLLAAANGDRLGGLYTAALCTGAREGELLALLWDDVDFGAGTLRIHRSVAHLHGRGFIVSEPKTVAGRRVVPLIPMAVNALRQHQERQAVERREAKDAWEEQGLVFTNLTGGFIRGAHLLKLWFYPLLEHAELPRIPFHSLRHTAASFLLQCGINANLVAHILGHSRPSTTTDIYGHILRGADGEAMARFGTYLDANFAVLDKEKKGDSAPVAHRVAHSADG